jgi:hypothetical protein
VEDVRKVTVLYEPYCRPWNGWTVDSGNQSRRGISRFSAAMVVEYGLGAAGYEFRTGTEAQRSRQRTR